MLVAWHIASVLFAARKGPARAEIKYLTFKEECGIMGQTGQEGGGMETTEYPIDEEFWKWWDNYWGKDEYWTSQKVDISSKLEYNSSRKKEEGENPKNGTA